MTQMKKACKQCRALVDGGVCPVCKNSDFGNTWNGRFLVLEHSKSAIAKRMAISANGDFALKVR